MTDNANTTETEADATPVLMARGKSTLTLNEATPESEAANADFTPVLIASLVFTVERFNAGKVKNIHVATCDGVTGTAKSQAASVTACVKALFPELTIKPAMMINVMQGQMEVVSNAPKAEPKVKDELTSGEIKHLAPFAQDIKSGIINLADTEINRRAATVALGRSLVEAKNYLNSTSENVDKDGNKTNTVSTKRWGVWLSEHARFDRTTNKNFEGELAAVGRLSDDLIRLCPASHGSAKMIIKFADTMARELASDTASVLLQGKEPLTIESAKGFDAVLETLDAATASGEKAATQKATYIEEQAGLPDNKQALDSSVHLEKGNEIIARGILATQYSAEVGSLDHADFMKTKFGKILEKQYAFQASENAAKTLADNETPAETAASTVESSLSDMPKAFHDLSVEQASQYIAQMLILRSGDYEQVLEGAGDQLAKMLEIIAQERADKDEADEMAAMEESAR